MTIIPPKEAEISFQEAEINFKKAISLEKEKREQGLQEFDEVIDLYKKTIELHPNHAGALNNLACLYLEIKSEDLDKIEDHRATAKEYYEKALSLRLVGVKHNLRLLDMAILSDLAEEFTLWADSYEEGRENKGVPNPKKAIKMYNEAQDTYKGLIDLLDDELTRIRALNIITSNAKLAQYENMLVYNKQLADKRKASLKNMIHRNELYMAGLRYEQKIGSDNEPNYDSAKKEYKKAMALGHVAARAIYRYLLNRNEKTKEAITRCETAIALGHTNAMLDRARLHEGGWGNNRVPQLDEAIELYKKAYDHGNKRAKAKIEELAKKCCTVSQTAVRMVCVERIADDVKSYEEFVNKLCDAMGILSNLYKEGWGNNGVAEYKKAEDLDNAIKFLHHSINVNRKNQIKSAHLSKRGEENNPNTAPSQPPQKRQKTTASLKSTLTTGGMLSTAPALIQPIQKPRTPKNLAGNPHTTFFTPSILRGSTRPSILKGAPPLKRQKTGADIPRIISQGRSASR